MKIPLILPRQVWFTAFGVALLLAFGWVATQSGPLAPIRVTVTQVVNGEVSPALFGIGTVEAQRAYLIGPTTACWVERASWLMWRYRHSRPDAPGSGDDPEILTSGWPPPSRRSSGDAARWQWLKPRSATPGIGGS